MNIPEGLWREVQINILESIRSSIVEDGSIGKDSRNNPDHSVFRISDSPAGIVLMLICTSCRLMNDISNTILVRKIIFSRHITYERFHQILDNLPNNVIPEEVDLSFARIGDSGLQELFHKFPSIQTVDLKFANINRPMYDKYNNKIKHYQYLLVYIEYITGATNPVILMHESYVIERETFGRVADPRIFIYNEISGKSQIIKMYRYNDQRFSNVGHFL